MIALFCYEVFLAAYAEFTHSVFFTVLVVVEVRTYVSVGVSQLILLYLSGVERLDKKSQLKEYIETLNNYTNEMREYTKNQLNSEDFLKILEKTENSANNTRRSFVLLNEQQEQRNIFPCIDSFSNI